MIKKDLTLSDIYVFTLVKTDNGLYRPMTDQEITGLHLPEFGDQVIDAMVQLLARNHVYRSSYVAKKLGLNLYQLNMVVQIHFGISLRELLSSYRRRRVLDLVRFTNLEPKEVARLSDFRSDNSLFVHFTKIEKEPMLTYRRRHQKVLTDAVEKYQIS